VPGADFLSTELAEAGGSCFTSCRLHDDRASSVRGPDALERIGPMIDHRTGALILSDARIGQDLTRSSFLATPMGSRARSDDMMTGWMHVYLPPQVLGDLTLAIDLVFEGERLDGYRLSVIDAKYGTGWGDYSEEKQLAQRDAHDAWLEDTLGTGEREATPRGMELRYELAWGKAWSTFDALGGSSNIGVRFRREGGLGT